MPPLLERTTISVGGTNSGKNGATPGSMMNPVAASCQQGLDVGQSLGSATEFVTWTICATIGLSMLPGAPGVIQELLTVAGSAVYGAGKDTDHYRYDSIIGALRSELAKV